MNAILPTDGAGTEQLSVKKESHGTVAFSDAVLIKIAEIAAGQVDGVTNMKIAGIEKEEHQVQVNVTTTLEYGAPLVETAGRVQDAVKGAVQVMTGLDVTAVNINVRALSIAE